MKHKVLEVWMHLMWILSMVTASKPNQAVLLEVKLTDPSEQKILAVITKPNVTFKLFEIKILQLTKDCTIDLIHWHFLKILAHISGIPKLNEDFRKIMC